MSHTKKKDESAIISVNSKKSKGNSHSGDAHVLLSLILIRDVLLRESRLILRVETLKQQPQITEDKQTVQHLDNIN